MLAVIFLLLALSGPTFPFVLHRVERGGLQIMFVLDLSDSMKKLLINRPSTSIPPASAIQSSSTPLNRLDAVKKSATDFVRDRPGDAIGLVVFSTHSYLVSPATFDHDSLLEYLQLVNLQTLEDEGFTAIGEGLNTAQQFFAFSKQKGVSTKGRVIVLLSDGYSNRGRDPMKEIERARREGTRVYFIGVDLEATFSQDIAKAVPSTGGKFFDVRQPRHLENALNEISKQEKGRFYTQQLVRQEPAYFTFALLAFIALALRMILNGIPHFIEIS